MRAAGGPRGSPGPVGLRCHVAPHAVAALVLASLGLLRGSLFHSRARAWLRAGLPLVGPSPSPRSSPLRAPSLSTTGPPAARPLRNDTAHHETSSPSTAGHRTSSSTAGPSLARPASPSGPFAAILLVVHNIREDRRYLFAGYYELFWDVWETHVPGDCRPGRSKCVGNCGNTNRCLAGIFRSLENLTRPPPAGALFIHFDLWINPGLFPIERLDRRKVWMTDRGLVVRWKENASNDKGFSWREKGVQNRCLEGSELYGHFLQTNNWFTMPKNNWLNGTGRAPWLDNGLKVLAKPSVQSLPALRGWGQNRLCFGWVDIMYIPYDVWPDWIELSPHFQHVFHESATYTMLNMLVRSGRAQGAETIDFCRGDCCHAVNPIGILRAPCGHRMNLIDERVRNSFEGMLRNYTAAQRSPGSTPR